MTAGPTRAEGGARRYLAVGVPLAVLATVLMGLLTTPIDLSVYQAGAREVLRGGRDLYHVTGRADYPFTYPPFAALLMAPLGWLAYTPAVYLMAALSTVALLRTVWVLSAPLDRSWRTQRPQWLRGRRRVAVGLLVAMLLTEPVYVTLALAQVNLLLMWLVVEDLCGPRRRRTGVLTGLAMGIKLTPGIFLLYLLLTRRWRAASWCAGVGLATIALAWATLPAASADFWGWAVTDPSRVGPREFTANQSLNGLVWRATGPGGSTPVWACLVLAVLALGVLAVRAADRTEPWTAVPLTALVGLLVSPISWDHHWVWGVPGALALLVLAGRWGARPAAAWIAGSLVAAQVTWSIWWLPFRYGKEWRTLWPLRFAYSTYVLAGVAALAWAAWSGRRAARRNQ